MNYGYSADSFFTYSPTSDPQSKNPCHKLFTDNNHYANSLQPVKNLDLSQSSGLTIPLTSSESAPGINHTNDLGFYFPDAFQTQAVLHHGYSSAFNDVYNHPSTSRVSAATGGTSPFSFDINSTHHFPSYNTETPWLDPGFDFHLNDPFAGVMVHPTQTTYTPIPHPHLLPPLGSCQTIRNKKAVAPVRKRKPYNKEGRIRTKPAQDEELDAQRYLAPPSPVIGVRIVPAFLQSTEPPKLRDSRGGCCPSEDKQIVVDEPAKHVPFKGMRPVAAKAGDMCRCRWDGCRFMVPATKYYILAHIRHFHKLKGTGRVRCQWHPPIRVHIPGAVEPVHVTSHPHSYSCDTLLQVTSVFNHIDSHLNHERQPNPNVVQCSSCKCDIVRRGGHSCADKGKNREVGEEGGEGGDGGENEEEQEKNAAEK